MGKPTKKSTDKRLLKAWGRVVKKRAGNKCEVCATEGKVTGGKLDPHHVVGKRNRRLRYDVRNGVCLCPKHHTLGNESAHQDGTVWFDNWMLDYRPDDRDYLNEVRGEIKKWTLPEMEEHLVKLRKLLDDLPE